MPAKLSKTHSAIAISLGLVYLLFGGLKFIPGASPAESLAIDAIGQLSFGNIPASWAIIMLAIWETGLGILFLIRRPLKLAIILGLIHMALTFTPLYFFPELCFTEQHTPTLLTQYILKNLVFIAAMIGIYPRR